MMNSSSYVWSRQNCIVLGGMLLVITLSACTTSKSQLPTANIAPIASPSITFNSSPPTTSVQSSVTPPSVVSTQNEDRQNQQQAVQVIRDYYSAIAQRHYEQAYSAWEGEGAASQQSFEQFKRGFANTESTAVEVGEPGRVDGAAGSSYVQIPITVTATTRNGTPQRFRGSYVLRRANAVPGSTPQQRHWHLYSANLSQIN